MEANYVTTQCNPHPPEPTAWDSRQIQAALSAAHHQAVRGARRLRLSRPDRDDLQQDILVAMLQRSRCFDPSKSAWSTFVGLVARHVIFDRMTSERSRRGTVLVPLELDQFQAGSSATLLGNGDPDASLDLDRVAGELPVAPQDLLRLIGVHGDVADAQRACPLSPAGFYRALNDLRFWLQAAGIRPPRGTARRRCSAVG